MGDDDARQPEGIGRGLLVVLTVVAPIATVFALGLQIVTLISVSWRSSNQGSSQYVHSQIVALVIGLGVPLAVLALGIVAVRRRRDGRPAVVLTVVAALRCAVPRRRGHLHRRAVRRGIPAGARR